MSLMYKIINFLNGFRKFTVMFMLIVIGTIFLVTKHLNGAEFVELLKYTAIAYMGSNGLEHMTNAVKDFLKNKIK